MIDQDSENGGRRQIVFDMALRLFYNQDEFSVS